ncbi:MAG: tetratricopeptide repeat protein [Bacteroidetes bacterium]|nr:tetratricopeptide repeat protein [Bacteroidota bacterium]
MFENSSEENFVSIKKFESMLKTNQVYFFDAEEFVDIIHYYFDLGKDNLAKQALKLANDQHPNSIEIKLLKAEFLINEDKIESATAILNELYLIEPTNEQLYLLKALIFSRNFESKRAIEMYKEALKYTDDEAEVIFLIAMEHFYLEEYEKAIGHFKYCLSVDNEDNQSLNNLIFCFEALKKSEDARNYLMEFIENNPYSYVAWFLLGKQHYALKNYKAALKAFDYALLIEETFVGALIEKGKSYEKLNKYEEAIGCYNETLRLEDASAYVFHKIAKCYEKLNNDNEAIDFYKKAIYEDPQSEKSWLALIRIYIKKNLLQNALAEIERAIEINEQSNKFKKNRDIILKQLGNK